MTKLLHTALVIFLLGSFSAFAEISPSQQASAYNHLFEINKEWSHRKNLAPNEHLSFSTDIDRISYHLKQVEKILRANAPKGIQGKSLERRLNLLDELKIYAEQKVFPTNHYHQERTPYFIDNFNVHCAVGYLIMRSGHGDLSKQISREHNFDYLRDIQTEGVKEWAKAYGFELNELAWIQPAYGSTQTFQPVGGGTNEPTRFVLDDQQNNRLIFIGEFSQIDGSTPCSQIGYYQNGQMYCLGGGIIGAINDAYVDNGKVVVAGLLEHNGSSYSMASYENGNWTYQNIPTREGFIATAVIEGNQDYKQELIIANDLGSNDHEIWRLSTNDTWEKQATAHGVLTCTGLGTDQQVYGGHFSSLTLHLSGGDQTLNATNVCLRENNSENWEALNGQVADTVLTAKWLNGTLFVAGSYFRSDFAYPSYALSIVHADTLLAMKNDFVNEIIPSLPMRITDLEVVGADSLILIAGDNFSFTDGMLEVGDCAGVVSYKQYDIYLSQVNYAWFSSYRNVGSWFYAPNGQTGVNDVVIHNGQLYLGVNIMDNIYSMDASLSIAPINKGEIKIYPNPTTNDLAISGIPNDAMIALLDAHGNIISDKSVNHLLDVSSYPSGLYFIQVYTGEQLIETKRFIKQ